MVKTIKQRLVDEGYGKDIPQEVSNVAGIIFEQERGLRLIDILSLYTSAYFPKALNTIRGANAIMGNVSSSLRVLEEEGYLVFNKGYYCLTPKAEESFSQ